MEITLVLGPSPARWAWISACRNGNNQPIWREGSTILACAVRPDRRRPAWDSNGNGPRAPPPPKGI